MALKITAVLLVFAMADDMAWESFKQTYGKNYNAAEEQARKEIFNQNLEHVAKLDSKKFAITQFMDLSQAEFKKHYMGLITPSDRQSIAYLGRHQYNDEALPDSVDWSAKGAVTEVKNQGQCGSCWSFSTTGSLEGAAEISTGKLVSMSEQQFVDCDTVDQGCNGGLMDNAFTYAKTSAICTEASYPYEAKDGSCRKSSCTVALAEGQVTGYVDVDKYSKAALMSAVAQQPVSIAVDAAALGWQYYTGNGVITSMCGTSLDHGVLVVGYGTWTDGTDYWRVKNSWGSSWGMDGYVLLERGVGGDGECGILEQPSYPVLASSVVV